MSKSIKTFFVLSVAFNDCCSRSNPESGEMDSSIKTRKKGLIAIFLLLRQLYDLIQNTFRGDWVTTTMDDANRKPKITQERKSEEKKLFHIGKYHILLICYAEYFMNLQAIPCFFFCKLWQKIQTLVITLSLSLSISLPLLGPLNQNNNNTNGRKRRRRRERRKTT